GRAQRRTRLPGGAGRRAPAQPGPRHLQRRLLRPAAAAHPLADGADARRAGRGRPPRPPPPEPEPAPAPARELHPALGRGAAPRLRAGGRHSRPPDPAGLLRLSANRLELDPRTDPGAQPAGRPEPPTPAPPAAPPAPRRRLV